MTILVMLDTETTGLNHKIDDICQFAAIVTYEGCEDAQIQVISTLCKPSIPIPKEVEALHGISNDMVKNSPTSSEVIKEFAEEIYTLAKRETVVVGGHNVVFDQRFLMKHSESLYRADTICTMRIARRYFEGAQNHKLGYLYRDFAKLHSPRTTKEHDALSDVWMSYELLRFWMQRDNMTQSYGELSLLLNTSTNIKTMPFGKHKGKAMVDLPVSYLQWVVEQPSIDFDVKHTARRLLYGNN